jgi:hypothetical protein
MAKKKPTTKDKKELVPQDEQTILAMKEAQEDELAEAVMQHSLEARMTPKFKNWLALFMDKANPDLYGNATQCALKSYNCTNYYSAGVIGSTNLKKLKGIMGSFLEAERMGYHEMIKIGAAKMIKGTFQDWKELMIMAGFYEQPAKAKDDGGNTFNIENMQFAIIRDRKARGLPIE